jgi:hypothetical protein
MRVQQDVEPVPKISAVARLGLKPLKVSKSLWVTEV